MRLGGVRGLAPACVGRRRVLGSPPTRTERVVVPKLLPPERSQSPAGRRKPQARSGSPHLAARPVPWQPAGDVEAGHQGGVVRRLDGVELPYWPS
jgi:hypothetical protein